MFCSAPAGAYDSPLSPLMAGRGTGKRFCKLEQQPRGAAVVPCTNVAAVAVEPHWASAVLTGRGASAVNRWERRPRRLRRRHRTDHDNKAAPPGWGGADFFFRIEP